MPFDVIHKENIQSWAISRFFAFLTLMQPSLNVNFTKKRDPKNQGSKILSMLHKSERR